MAFTKNRHAQSVDEEPLCEINVTPFVDVVLVLLIIFMITAAVVEFGLRVDVPPTKARVTEQLDPKYQTLEVSDDGRLVLNGAAVNLYAIVPAAKQANPGKPALYIRIHKSAKWEDVAQVMAECRAGGVEINLIPRPLTRNPRG
jgi:biopolymer transport protein ExbD